MHMSCRRWMKWESCILSRVTILLICSLNHYRHHLLRDVFVRSVWWDLKRCKNHGEILYNPASESRSRWLSTQPDVEWIVLFFPYVSFPDVSHIEVFTRQFVQHEETYSMRSFSIFFPLSFSEFWYIDNTGWRTKGECWETSHAHRAGPPFLGWGVFPIGFGPLHLPLSHIYTHVLYKKDTQ